MSKKPYVILGNRNSSLLMQYGTLDSFRHKVPGTEWSIPTTFISSRNSAGDHCHHIQTRRKMRKLLEQELRDGVYTELFFKNIHQSFKLANKKIKEFSKNNFAQLPADKLVEYFDIFYQILIVTLFPMIVAIYSSDLQDLLDRELKLALKKKAGRKQLVTELTSVLLSPSRLSFLQKEEQILFSLQNYLQKEMIKKSISKRVFHILLKQKYVQQQLKRLVSGYGWFHMEYVNDPWQRQDYIHHLWERILDAQRDPLAWKNQLSPRQRLKIIKKKQQQFFKSQSRLRFLKSLSIVLQEFALILDYSKAELIYGIYLARPLIEEISRRLKVNSWVLVRNLTPDELKLALKKGKLTVKQRKDIDKRAKAYALLLKDGKIFLYQDKEAQVMRERLLESEDTKGITEVKGITAMTGRAQGRVKIVTSARDLSKIREGDIMVTHDTSTEMTSVMKKAAAIVADLGGLVSHSAIVAREFKTPCIVRAKIARQVFKDGDLVEVDADRGVVRKL